LIDATVRHSRICAMDLLRYGLDYPRDVVSGPNVKCRYCDEMAARKSKGLDTPFGSLCELHADQCARLNRRNNSAHVSAGLCRCNAPCEKKINGIPYTFCRACRLSNKAMANKAKNKRLAIMRNGGKLPLSYLPPPFKVTTITEYK